MTGRVHPDSLADEVAEHYERWPFPGIDHESQEGLALLRRLRRWLDLRPRGRAARLLDVGCGTGHTTLALARRLPEVELVGVDVSSASLAEARSLAQRQGTDRVTFLRADARDLPENLGVFDVAIALGVLHHIPDFESALEQIVSRVVTGGHVVLWLYGRHGRAAHQLNQRFMSLVLGDHDSDEHRLMLARALLQESGGRFVVGSGIYTPRGSREDGVRWLLQHPAWLADQMLPPFERAFTLEEIFTLLDTHGLEPEHWIGLPDDVSLCVNDTELRGRIAALPRRDQYVAVECLFRPSYYMVSGRRCAKAGKSSP